MPSCRRESGANETGGEAGRLIGSWDWGGTAVSAAPLAVLVEDRAEGCKVWLHEGGQLVGDVEGSLVEEGYGTVEDEIAETGVDEGGELIEGSVFLKGRALKRRAVDDVDPVVCRDNWENRRVFLWNGITAGQRLFFC